VPKIVVVKKRER